MSDKNTYAAIELFLQLFTAGVNASARIKRAHAEGRTVDLNDVKAARAIVIANLADLDASIAQAEAEGR